MRASFTFFILGWLILLIGVENGIQSQVPISLITGIGLSFEVARAIFFFWMILAGASFIYGLKTHPERQKHLRP